ncbi:SsgA family sporulation/cell division regulator [Amycolatopsis sp.]|uniref:SsgA family sporulation/cell division regulator n=1 Tax=Amycolatopsis sp. TaxID=37632 RepID=UPI002D7E490D|nr:SsgA family sporulation/cell division regulator [Amycolatopsis sp.]HET6710684.1 SsgA family sporulation/cell division regulator [Amycolatopsis sp.]
MSSEYTVIKAILVLEVRSATGGSTPLRADLRYDSREPYAVALTLHTGRGPVEWLAARELLIDGLHAPAGLGDVRVAPAADPAVTVVELRSPNGRVALEAGTAEIVDFLYRTCEALPRGEESRAFDFDRELAKLTSE